MKKLMNISIIILLTVLTCCIIFVPKLISGQGEDDLLNEVVYRSYRAGNRPKLTSEQVARLYCNHEISIGYDLLPVMGENCDTDTIRKDVTDLAGMLFGDDETVYGPIKEILKNGDISYLRNSSLVKIDNQPIALNFVNCSIKKENAFFEILYEEKTKTVIRIIYDNSEKNFNKAEYMNLYLEKEQSMISEYYEKQLHLSKDEYYFFAIPTETETYYNGNIYISYGLMQYGEKVIYEEDSIQ